VATFLQNYCRHVAAAGCMPARGEPEFSKKAATKCGFYDSDLATAKAIE